VSCRPLGRELADKLANRFQPRLLDFRLRRRQQVASSRFDVPEFAYEVRMVAMTLGSVLEGEPKLQERRVAALRTADEDWKSLHSQSDAAIVLEALLVACHEDRREVYANEIKEIANVLLMARQAKKELSAEAVGHILHNELGLDAKRDGPGRALMLTRYNRQRIHNLARSYHTLSSLQPRAGCLQCFPAPPPEVGAAHQEPETLHNVPNLHSVAATALSYQLWQFKSALGADRGGQLAVEADADGGK
jgi:hypothetical protein